MNGSKENKKLKNEFLARNRAHVSAQGDTSASHSLHSADKIVTFKVMSNKQFYEIEYPLNETVKSLKNHIQNLTGIPSELQKLLNKRVGKDDETLNEFGVKDGLKVLLLSTKAEDIISLVTVAPEEEKEPEILKEAICKQTKHKKIIDHGMPEDVMPGILKENDSLPSFPIFGMVNEHMEKVRLIFKLEEDEVWISTKEDTLKLPMNAVENVVSEPIEEHEEYHIVGIQQGTTEKSIYWLYWVPAQYVEAIKETILGEWEIQL